MAQVKFLQDYRGQFTGEVFYTAGTVAPFSADVADKLVKAGRAAYHEVVASTATLPAPEPVEVPDLSALTVATLRTMAEAAGVDGFKRMRKAALIAAIEEVGNG